MELDSECVQYGHGEEILVNMKTVQQIMEESGAKENIQNFRYMQQNYTYEQSLREQPAL